MAETFAQEEGKPPVRRGPPGQKGVLLLKNLENLLGPSRADQRAAEQNPVPSPGAPLKEGVEGENLFHPLRGNLEEGRDLFRGFGINASVLRLNGHQRRNQRRLNPLVTSHEGADLLLQDRSQPHRSTSPPIMLIEPKVGMTSAKYPPSIIRERPLMRWKAGALRWRR